MIFPRLSFSKRSNWPATDDRWYSILPTSTSSGVSVDESESLKYLTVFACVSLIAAIVARLPLNLYKKNPDGSKELTPNHPAYNIVHSAPNKDLVSYNWRESAMSHLLLWGNTYSTIQRDTYSGDIKSIHLIPDPGGVEVMKNTRGIFYRWKENGFTKRKLAKDVLHIPGFGFSGLVGKSMIALAREAIGLGLAAEQFGGKFFGSGTHPAGILSMEGWLGENEEHFKESFKKGYSGLGKSHSVIVLEGGAEYKPITMPLEDAQFLQTRNHQRVEIAAMYHVPPHRIGLEVNTSYKSMEEENRAFLDVGIFPWTRKWEQYLNLKLLREEERKAGYFFEFEAKELLKGDHSTRAEFYSKMFQIGAMSPNDIRAKENLNPYDDGNDYYVPLNMLEVGADRNGDQQEIEQERNFIEVGPNLIETRSIKTRDKIIKRFNPLIESAAQKIVNRESIAISREVNKQIKGRGKVELQSWLDEFYLKMPAYIRREIGPVFETMGAMVWDDSLVEIGADVSQEEFNDFIQGYIDVYAERHVSSSTGQIYSLLNEDPEPLEAVDDRMIEWTEKRPEKIANNETHRLSNAVFMTAAFGAGMSIIWQIRGAKTCPYCRSLKGKRIARGQSYFSGGQTIEPAGATNGPMKIKGKRKHPPLHRGCDCFVSAI